ncbi:hypothetical protein P4O66_014027, partial [Electrophorus voltai]
MLLHGNGSKSVSRRMSHVTLRPAGILTQMGAGQRRTLRKPALGGWCEEGGRPAPLRLYRRVSTTASTWEQLGQSAVIVARNCTPHGCRLDEWIVHFDLFTGKDSEEEEEVAVGVEKAFMDEFFEQ